uniref:Uncharacterized protein n=1 Tax=Chromera velia CCMP2878 TaxID=1169474 RepID=A0A0G4FVE4_9ALVE|eukprot:Cvel_490.t1-p1 / transcript=Cvel_490.t1 / gene=Cvel_490 / organism=Chromera_velia_CCMP2878 / gene_product=hypothetical protein / transcript_product=hypothetical protein / location=Cvel_scaffold15:132596-137304(-) / protein_length=161 / sequence_SO=supercontig / SO=protein_coding / is_pseudo=false
MVWRGNAVLPFQSLVETPSCHLGASIGQDVNIGELRFRKVPNAEQRRERGEADAEKGRRKKQEKKVSTAAAGDVKEKTPTRGSPLSVRWPAAQSKVHESAGLAAASRPSGHGGGKKRGHSPQKARAPQQPACRHRDAERQGVFERPAASSRVSPPPHVLLH